jgi:hypothetical protein
MNAATIRRMFAPGQEWEVTNHYLTRVDHPYYGTTVRKVVRVSSNGVTLEAPKSTEEPHLTRWPKAAHLTLTDDGAIDWRGHPSQPDAPFLTFRQVTR